MKHKTIVGIDPGQKGAIAVFNTKELDIWDMKPLITPTGTFNSLDAVKLSELIQSAVYRDPDEVAVFCEESLIVHGNGIKTARPIFDSRGVLRAVFTLYGLPVHFVTPQAWKAHFGLTRAEKTASVEKAVELLPKYADMFQKHSRGKTVLLDGRAEAALIGLYGMKLLPQDVQQKILNGTK